MISLLLSLCRSDDVKCQKPVPVCTDMKMHICNFSLKTVVLEKVLKKFRGTRRGTRVSETGLFRALG